MRTGPAIQTWRAFWLCLMAIGVVIAIPVGTRQPSVEAAGSCLVIVASRFDPPGNDNANLNGEWIRIRNGCGSERAISGWRVTDLGSQNVYRFPTPFRLAVRAQVTLYSGDGTDTAGRRYWDRDGEVWANSPPEFAFLRKPDGAVVSRWTEYASPSTSPTGGPSSSPSTSPSTSPSSGASSSPSTSPSDSPDPSPTDPYPSYSYGP